MNTPFKSSITQTRKLRKMKGADIYFAKEIKEHEKQYSVLAKCAHYICVFVLVMQIAFKFSKIRTHILMYINAY